MNNLTKMINITFQISIEQDEALGYKIIYREFNYGILVSRKKDSFTSVSYSLIMSKFSSIIRNIKDKKWFESTMEGMDLIQFKPIREFEANNE